MEICRQQVSNTYQEPLYQNCTSLCYVFSKLIWISNASSQFFEHQVKVKFIHEVKNVVVNAAM